MSQLSEIRTNVQSYWPDNYHSSFLGDTKTDEYINSIKNWVCKGTIITPDYKMVNYNFSWMKIEVEASTVDEQRRYTLPSASDARKFKQEISCELVNSDDSRIPLTRRLKRDIENDPTYKDTTGLGVPKEYCIDQNELWLYPLPDHSCNSGSAWTINLEYYGYLADLTGDTDTNKITDDFPLVLEYGAAEMGFRYGQDYDQAEYYKKLKIEQFIIMLRVDQQEVLANIERGMEPVQGSSLSDGGPGYGNYYNNDTPYS